MRIVNANGKNNLQISRSEWEQIGLKFEEAKKKKKPGMGRGPCGSGLARGRTKSKGTGRGKQDGTGPRSKIGLCPKNKTAQDLSIVQKLDLLDDRELTRAIRDAIIAEESAIKQYEVIVDSAKNAKVKSVLQEIADEERIHVGELQTLLNELLKDEKDLLQEGEKEVSNH